MVRAPWRVRRGRLSHAVGRCAPSHRLCLSRLSRCRSGATSSAATARACRACAVRTALRCSPWRGAWQTGRCPRRPRGAAAQRAAAIPGGGARVYDRAQRHRLAIPPQRYIDTSILETGRSWIRDDTPHTARGGRARPGGKVPRPSAPAPPRCCVLRGGAGAARAASAGAHSAARAA